MQQTTYAASDTTYSKLFVSVLTSGPIQSNVGHSILVYDTFSCNYRSMRIFHIIEKEQRYNQVPSPTTSHCLYNLELFIPKIPSSGFTYSSTTDKQLLELKNSRVFTITQLSQNQILLVGEKEARNKANKMLWQGSLMGSEIKELSWAPLTLELVTARSNAMCFKLKENFYIAVGYAVCCK